MKKIFLYLIIFVVLCWIGNQSIDYTIGKQIANQSPYYLSFASIGAISLESRLDCWAKIKTTSTFDELESYMQNILKCLHVTDEKKLTIRTQSENSRILRYESDRDDTRLIVILESDSQTNETYFIITAISNSDNNWKKYKSELNKLIGLNFTYYHTYKGEINTLVDNDSQMQLIQVVMNNLKANNLKPFREGKTISCTGYSPLVNKIISPVKINGQKCNVQAAVQVDEKKAKTNIIIGSPLILGEY